MKYAALIAAGALLAQAPAAFEVATVKPADPDGPKGRYIRMQSAQQFIARNHSLKTLIAGAYNLSPKVIFGGMPWTEDEHFDIAAKTPGGARPSLDRQMAMLRALLAERFGLAFHREPREMPYYALTVAKGGPKLKDSTLQPDATPEGPPALVFVIAPPFARLPARYATMGDLASVMQRAALDKPVIDKTSLTGHYDFDLEWTPDETQFGNALGNSADAIRADLFAALQQQLGLKLEATRGPVDVFIIDQAHRPSAN